MSGREKVVALTGHRALENFDEDALAYESSKASSAKGTPPISAAWRRGSTCSL